MFCHGIDNRAIPQLCIELSGHFARTGIDATLVGARVSPEARSRIPDGVRVVDLNAPVDRTTFAIPALARALRRLRPDAFFSHGNGPNRAAVVAHAMSRTGAALLLVEHNHYSSYVAPDGGGYRHRRLRDLLTGGLYPRADRVVGVAPDLVADLAERFPGVASRAAVLGDPGRDPAELARLRNEPVGHPWYEQSPRPRIVCSVANVIPRKGQDTLVEALPRVRELAGDVRLVLIGRHDNEDFLNGMMQRAKQLGVADWIDPVGYRQNPVPLMANADVFALASLNEGCPRVLSEAMACGVPVVSTDCPSGPSYILEGGKSGCLVEIGDAPAMAEALARLLTDDSFRGTMIERGRARAERFTPARIAADYLDLARQAING
jgi:glycosyltransferase involved in cell wall biosynthesis